MSVPTIGTDGKTIYYTPEFVARTPADQLEGVLAHLITHIFLWHLPRRSGRDHLKWAIATDLAVNNLVGREFHLPMGYPRSREYCDKSAEWIYDRLPEPTAGHLCNRTGLDDHNQWGDWDNDQNNIGRENDENKDNSRKEDQDQLESEWKNRIAQALTQARAAGKMPGNLEKLTGYLLQPRLTWREILRNLVISTFKNDYRYQPPAKKHLWRRIYLPSTKGEEINVAIAIDDSGSMGNQEIKTLLSEVGGICDTFNNYTIYLLVCDTSVQQRFELHPGDPLPKTIVGRGGTDFQPVFDEVRKLSEIVPVSCLIYGTDGFPNNGWPAANLLDIPVIWVMTSNVMAPFGTTVQMPRDG